MMVQREKPPLCESLKNNETLGHNIRPSINDPRQTAAILIHIKMKA
jgi:hypothetical protein